VTIQQSDITQRELKKWLSSRFKVVNTSIHLCYVTESKLVRI
jgi:hypothetical protein